MKQVLNGSADWAAEVAGRVINHIAALLERGLDYQAARAEAAACSTAGPMAWRLVDQHFAGRA